MPRPRRASPAIRAEPRSVGSARARDPLAREVRLLGALLGQVIAEQDGPQALELVERVRGRAIALRRHRDPAARRALDQELAALDPPALELLAHAFSTFFQLANLAEEKERVRALRRRERAAGRAPLGGSMAEAVDRLASAGLDAATVAGRLAGLEISPVLTAHPTEARRRTVILALRRVYDLLDLLDDARLTPAGDAEIRRRLREEITILWRTADLRAERPTPLDEVRSAMVFFDATLFVAIPAPVPHARRSARPARRMATRRVARPRTRDGRAPGRPSCRPSSAGARGSAATATGTPSSRRRRRSTRCESRPTTCCTRTRRPRRAS